MSESIQHMKLVQLLYDEVKKLVPPTSNSLIQIDKPDSFDKPAKTIEGFIPDLRYSFKGLKIIGEAKTVNDFDRKHSKSQYISYLKECSNFNGESILVVFVSFKIFRSAKKLLKKLKIENNCIVTIRIVSELGLVDVV